MLLLLTCSPGMRTISSILDVVLTCSATDVEWWSFRHSNSVMSLSLPHANSVFAVSVFRNTKFLAPSPHQRSVRIFLPSRRSSYVKRLLASRPPLTQRNLEGSEESFTWHQEICECSWGLSTIGVSPNTWFRHVLKRINCVLQNI